MLQQVLICLILVSCWLGSLYLLRWFMKCKLFKNEARIDGKIVVITGANSGIGKETAIDLAQRGGKIYIACRDQQRADAALKEIKVRSGNDDVHFLKLDLASLESIRDFCQKFHALENKLHILINNAGVLACPRSLTVDGFEMQIGTNHLGHFLLTNLLLGRLKAAAPSRIVVVSSLAHIWGYINKDDLMSSRSYSKVRAYCQSKLANNLFTHELSKKLEGTGVTINSLHPGVVVTELLRHFHVAGRLISCIEPLARLIVNTPKEASQASIRLAVDPVLEKVSGKYFRKGVETAPSRASKCDELSAWLWMESEHLVGLNNV